MILLALEVCNPLAISWYAGDVNTIRLVTTVTCDEKRETSKYQVHQLNARLTNIMLLTL